MKSEQLLHIGLDRIIARWLARNSAFPIFARDAATLRPLRSAYASARTGFFPLFSRVGEKPSRLYQGDI